MKVETSHARSLFRTADETNDGYLEYREFLSLMSILYKGKPEDKLKLIFECAPPRCARRARKRALTPCLRPRRTYDVDGSGQIDEDEMRLMLRNTLTIEDKARARHAAAGATQGVTLTRRAAAPQAEKEKAIEDIVDKAFREMDIDGDLVISLEELIQAFKKRPEMLTEYFGQNIIDCDNLF